MLLLMILLSRSLTSATLDQFLPWLSPNPLSFGTSFADFKKVRPAAVDISGKEVTTGQPFEGGLFERMTDGSYFLYSFYDDKFEATYWGNPASSEVIKLLLVVRDSLLQTCGEPTFGTSGRIKTDGGVAKIVWEQYRPRMDQNYRITLKANSESGIEVFLFNESEANKRSIKTDNPTYEEVAQSLPLSVQTSDSPSVLVDLLDEVRSGRISATSQAQQPERENNGPLNPNRQLLGMEKGLEAKAASVEPKEDLVSSTPWGTIIAVVVATIFGLLWLLLKRRASSSEVK